MQPHYHMIKWLPQHVAMQAVARQLFLSVRAAKQPHNDAACSRAAKHRAMRPPSFPSTEPGLKSHGFTAKQQPVVIFQREAE